MAKSIVNNFTTQKPLNVLGSTGLQLLALIPASRVFIKTTDPIIATPVSSYASYSFKTNGQTPTGWSDLGIMDSPAKIVYTKNVEKVQTGMDKVTRRTYAKSKEATLDFSLWQTDDYLLSQLGFNGSVVTAGSAMSFFIGQEDVIQAALLCVYCNKLDGKELHLYHPSASLSVTFEDNGGKLMTKVAADLTAFTPAGQTVDALYVLNVFAAGPIAAPVQAPPTTIPLVDTTNGHTYLLSMVNGVLSFTQTADGTQGLTVKLADTTNGLTYSIQMVNGTLTFTVTGSSGSVVSTSLSDTTNGHVYALQMINGTLSFTQTS